MIFSFPASISPRPLARVGRQCGRILALLLVISGLAGQAWAAGGLPDNDSAVCNTGEKPAAGSALTLGRSRTGARYARQFHR